MIDTARNPDRRRLRLAAPDELRTEIDRIVAADKAGRLRRGGNWTAGQAFGHVAAWINYAYEGYPIHPPFFIRWILQLRRAKYLRDGMPTGVRIPRVKDGTFGTELRSTDEGADRLRRALDRMEREPAKFDSPAFGKMPDADRIQFNLRHAELHLGFLHPQ